MGDAVMTMPAIRAIRHANPEAHITLLVKPWVAPLFELDPSIDSIMHYTDAHKGILGKFRLARELKEKKFDRAILLQNAFDAAAAVFLARIPARIGYDRDGRGLLLTDAISHGGRDRMMHHIDYYLDLLSEAGIPNAGRDTWLFLGINERLEARAKLSGLKRPILGINPGASYGSAKQWLPDRFAEVARRIIEELGGSVVVFGGPGEVDIAADITGRLSGIDTSKLMNMAGKTSLRELASLMSECDSILSNDSGPMHMADAMGVPLTAIFGSTSAELTGPRKASSQSIVAPLECSPCFKRVCPDGDSLACMEAIGVEEVFAVIKSSVKHRRAVIFDRDGTLCEDANYLNSWDNFKVFDEVSSLNSLIDNNYRLIGISNQSGIDRGIVNEAFVHEVNKLFLDKLGFSAFYYCPHHPNKGCSCRKPEPGLALRASNELGVNLRESFVVGDKDADMLLGRAIGAYTILVTTGKQQTSEHADFIATGLSQAVSHILSH